MENNIKILIDKYLSNNIDVLKCLKEMETLLDILFDKLTLKEKLIVLNKLSNNKLFLNKINIIIKNYSLIYSNLTENLEFTIKYYNDLLANENVDEEKDDSKYIDSFKLYMKEINEHSILPDEEIRKLFVQYHNGSKEAFNKIIESNLRLVVYIANLRKRLSSNENIDLEELINEGNIGLVEAATRYNETSPSKFSTYASFWINRYIYKSFCYNRSIRIPSHILYGYNKLIKIKKNYFKKNGKELSDNELALLLNVPKGKIKEILNYGSLIDSKTSLEDLKYDDGELMVSYETNIDIDINSCFNKKYFVKAFNELFKELDIKERYKEILKYRYGLIDGRFHSFEETGKYFGGIKKQRIDQIEKKVFFMLENNPKLNEFYKNYLTSQNDIDFISKTH